MTSILTYRRHPEFSHFVYRFENDIIRDDLYNLLKLNGVTKYSLGWNSEDQPTHSLSYMTNYDKKASVGYELLKTDVELTKHTDNVVINTKWLSLKPGDPELAKYSFGVHFYKDTPRHDNLVSIYRGETIHTGPGSTGNPNTFADKDVKTWVVDTTKLVVPDPVTGVEFVSNDKGVWVYKLNGTTYAQLYDLAKKAGVDKWDGATHPRAYLHRSFGANHNSDYTLTGLVKRAVDNYPHKPSPYFYCDADLFGTKTKEEAPKMNTPVKTTNVGKFIVWSPQSKKPPTVVMDSEDQAKAVCEKMSIKNPGNEFYYAKLSGGTLVTITSTKL
jgi:hypothetical protein